MIIVSTQELLHEPTPLAAIALTSELIVVEIDLLAHLVGHYLRGEVDDHAARLRHELEIKGDELRRNAAAIGLDWQQFFLP